MTITEYGTDSERQDPAFYTYGDGRSLTWRDNEKPRFYVICNGEMRIHAVHNGHEEVVRTVEDLADIGINNDEQLEKLSANEEICEWVNNSWFEVLDDEDPDWFSDPIHELDEAVKFVLELTEKFGESEPIDYEKLD